MSIVVVNFQPKNAETGVAAEEVLIEAHGNLVEVDDKDIYMTSLSRLVPLALSQMSPKRGNS